MSDIPKNIKKLALSRDLKATIRIGKSGLTENLVSEIIGQLSSKNIVKIILINILKEIKIIMKKINIKLFVMFVVVK